jgi:hypothetical protein
MGIVMSYTTIIQNKLTLTTKKILYAVVDQAKVRHKHHDLFSKMVELTIGMTVRLSSSCVNGDVKYFDNIDEAMTYSVGYDIVIVQSIGNFINRNKFFSELDNYIVNNPNFFIVAFTLDWQSEKGTGWIECHNQFMVVNVSSWKQLGKPKFGDWEERTEELPNYSRSVENFHDNYTPYWIKGELGTTRHTRTAQGWNFIKTALASGYQIDNFTEEMRACRLFIYPEHESDNLYKAFISKDGSSLTNPNQKRWIKNMLNAPPGIWIFNSEYYRFSIDMKKVDTYFGPAAGFKYLDFLNYNPNGKFIFYDYNDESLIWIKKLKETWDGEDFYTYLQEQPTEVRQYYKFIHGNKFNKENIEKNIEILFKEFGGKDQFKKLWSLFRQSETTFVRVDLFNPEEITKLLNLSNSEYVFFNFSNIFATDFTLLNHTIAEVDIIYYNFLLQVENKFSKFILYGSDPTGTWQTLNKVPQQVSNNVSYSSSNNTNSTDIVVPTKQFNKMTQNLIAKNLITPLTVIDVGCSGGLFEKFRKFEPLLKGLGADPIIEECSRLHSIETNPNIKYIPTFVGTTINKNEDLRFCGYNWERTTAGNFSLGRTKK